jgi:HEAT repeat protein
MASVFDLLDRLGPAGVVLQAIAAAVLGITILLAFILLRRAWRTRLYRRRDARLASIRAQWDAIVDGKIPADDWRHDRLSAEVVETLLLDALDDATADESARLSLALRRSGLVEARIRDARTGHGWRQRQALTALGRMRAVEAIPAMTAALDHSSRATVITAVRALGRLGSLEAAEPLLEHLVSRPDPLPSFPVQNAIIGVCRERPEVVAPYLDRATPELKRTLVRALSEIANGGMTDVLLRLTTDPESEVRASAARLLPMAPITVALPALNALANDREWFVRLRAIVALGQLGHAGATSSIVKGLCDPHRFVRLRAARGLATMEEHLPRILDEVEATRDRYAMQALLSELELSGVVMGYVNRLSVAPARGDAERLVARIVNLGARRLIVSALVEHEDASVRNALARVLSSCAPDALLPLLERTLAQQPAGDARALVERVRRGLLDTRRAADEAAALKAVS